MRVCIVADSASVRFGGEAILPYHYFRLLRRRGVEAWLVVHERTRAELEQLLPGESHRILYTPDLALHRLLSRTSVFLPRRIAEATLGLLSQILTQRSQRALIRHLCAAEKIDVIHQPTPVSPRLPSLLFNVGAPVVIGPMNGGMDFPPAFRNHESAFSRIFVQAGRHFSNLVNRLVPGKQQAAVILVANPRTRCALPAGVQGHVMQLVENAVDLDTWSAHAEEATKCDVGKPANFLFVGRLVDWKRLDIAMKALAHVPQATMDVVGDGPMRTIWEAMAKEFHIAERITFKGWLPQRECAHLLSQSVALLLPSIYECGGAVVLEAMASERPVIATRWGGPADYLDSTCGFLVDPLNEEAMVAGFADSMRQLLADPDRARQMGRSGRLRVVECFNWSHKIDAIEQIYRVAAGTSLS